MSTARLSDFCRIIGGGRLKLSGKQFVESGYPAYGAGGMNGFLDVSEFDGDGIVLSSIGARCGKCFLAQGEWTSLANTQLIFPDPKRADIRFVWYQLNDEERWPRSGAAQPFIRPSDVKSHEIYLPPLDEQRRILAVLDEAFAAIATATANVEKNLANARELFESYGGALFSDLLNSSIEHIGLGDLTAPGSGITYGVVKPGGEGSVAFIRGGDLVDGIVRMDRLRTISQEFSHQYRRTLLHGGELLICLVGTPGQCAIAPKELAGANIARQVGMIRLRDEVNAKYVRDYLLSRVGQNALGLKTGGSVQQVINLGDLKLIEIPLPDIFTQSEIVEKLRLIKESVLLLEQHCRDKLVELAALRQSLLQRAFSGEPFAAEIETIAA